MPAKLAADPPHERNPKAVKTRELTLDHHWTLGGQATQMLLNGAHYSMPVTETPARIRPRSGRWSI